MKVRKTLFRIVALGIFLAIYDMFIRPFYLPIIHSLGFHDSWASIFGLVSFALLGYTFAWFVTRGIP
ncbi:hypothetical protein KEJ18_04645 [Candidatus Bathyarchaeota archaeon]|nr:hypothetical protein [Candidatus Bathyarchaeota archaeon]